MSQALTLVAAGALAGKGRPSSCRNHEKLNNTRPYEQFITNIGFAFLLSLNTALADDAVATKLTLTLDGAKRAGDAAAAYAKQNGAGGRNRRGR